MFLHQVTFRFRVGCKIARVAQGLLDIARLLMDAEVLEITSFDVRTRSDLIVQPHLTMKNGTKYVLDGEML